MFVIQKIIRYTRGYVRIRVQGYSSERFLNLCSRHEIFIWGVEPAGDTYELFMPLSGFWKIRAIARKTHTKVTVIQRFGLPFFVYQNRRRQAFLAGCLLCIGLLFFYSSYIWDIHFEGNERWTDEALLDFLETRQVKPGTAKYKINCPEIVRDIRQQYPEIVWVSASIDGSRLRVQIKENEALSLEQEKKNIETEELNPSPKDLVASCDGVITSIITRNGVPQVHVGETVKKGDLLVSGRVEIKNDAKEVIDYQYCQADADVFADTQMQYQESIPLIYYEKNYQKNRRKSAWYVKIGRRIISFGVQSTNEKLYEKICSEYQICLGEHFYLPVTYGKITVKPYTLKRKKQEKRKVQQILTEKFDSFLKDLEEKGIQICENNVKIHLDENSATADGILYLNQKITETVDAEILEIERNEQNESIRTDD